MQAETQSPLHEEHAGLLTAADALRGHLEQIDSWLDYGGSQLLTHTDWAYRAQWLRGHLTSAWGLIGRNEYPSAFALLRVALEHHLVDRLLFLGTAVVEYVQRPSDKSADEVEAELERARLADDRNIVAWRATGKSRSQYRIVSRSPRASNDPSFSLGLYNFLLDEYEPTAGRPRHVTRMRRNFEALEEMKEAARRADSYWRTYLTLQRILENLTECDLLTDHELLQVELHYSFLSAYVHATSFGYGSVRGNVQYSPSPPEYDHYASELGLLYIIRIAGEELRHLHRAYEKSGRTSITHWDRIERDLRAAEAASSHFWFLGSSEPHWYDRVMSVSDEMWVESEEDAKKLRAMQTIDPASLTFDQITYDPNPLHRLIDMHRGGKELTTGASFTSPFRRRDADFR